MADQAIESVEAHGDLCYLPDLLRVKGSLMLAMRQASADAAEACFRRSIELSRHQGARAWELRAAIDLAAVLAGRGERESARALLRPVFDALGDPSATADLRAAAALLARLNESEPAASARHRRR